MSGVRNECSVVGKSRKSGTKIFCQFSVGFCPVNLKRWSHLKLVSGGSQEQPGGARSPQAPGVLLAPPGLFEGTLRPVSVSFIHSFIHPSIHPSIHSFIHSFIHTQRSQVWASLRIAKRFNELHGSVISNFAHF